ncbi:putative calcium-binding protein CML10 [Tasmannia lanceolata]|uniref:putative calcium-binding protein CML10 n=1 Tax=Tasmannia lanceolata TaxID=3420 RepID=UPI004063A64A
MFSSQNLHFSPLLKWVRTLLHQANAWGKAGCKLRRRKLKRLSTGYDWLSSSIGSMEISNQLKQVFKVMDANGDGKISLLELRQVLVCLGRETSDAAKEAEVIVKEVDCNGDGFIDLDEFMEVVSEKSEDGGSSKEDLMDAFLIFDTDGNGFISAKELQRVLISLGHTKCSLDECLLMIRGVDKNGDGLVDFEEFQSMMAGGSAW